MTLYNLSNDRLKVGKIGLRDGIIIWGVAQKLI